MEIFNQSLSSLEYSYGVKNLNLAEQISLKNIIKKCLREDKSYGNRREKGEIILSTFFSVESEVIFQWLYSRFGIKDKDIPMMYIITNPLTGEVKKFEKYQEKEAKKLQENIKKEIIHLKGAWNKMSNEDYQRYHDPIFDYGVTDDFKEYIRRLRSKYNPDV